MWIDLIKAPEVKPSKLVGKYPMEQRVIDDKGRVFEYFVTDFGIKYLYLFSTYKEINFR